MSATDTAEQWWVSLPFFLPRELWAELREYLFRPRFVIGECTHSLEAKERYYTLTLHRGWSTGAQIVLDKVACRTYVAENTVRVFWDNVEKQERGAPSASTPSPAPAPSMVRLWLGDGVCIRSVKEGSRHCFRIVCIGKRNEIVAMIDESMINRRVIEELTFALLARVTADRSLKLTIH